MCMDFDRRGRRTAVPVRPAPRLDQELRRAATPSAPTASRWSSSRWSRSWCPSCCSSSWDDVERARRQRPRTHPVAKRKSVKAYFALLLVLETMMIGVFAATDVFLFYVFFEAMLIPMYFLIGSLRRSAPVSYAAVKFLLYSLFGGLLMLAAVIGLYVQSAKQGAGTFSFEALTQARDEPHRRRPGCSSASSSPSPSRPRCSRSTPGCPTPVPRRRPAAPSCSSACSTRSAPSASCATACRCSPGRPASSRPTSSRCR